MQDGGVKGTFRPCDRRKKPAAAGGGHELRHVSAAIFGKTVFPRHGTRHARSTHASQYPDGAGLPPIPFVARKSSPVDAARAWSPPCASGLPSAPVCLGLLSS